ncbi:hypothetical protein CBER1_05301 [Cercospora berteroae]|uniref:succinate-semialdehyde dehydrogenase [NAD(P)(+)] n=1 Tax=Cercospora berteroae TaxID=357750 RepID=A0A2S6CEE9_9PEZI|nr:hypothetical protein CBER1_05301 [Cercospora berteroae]
MRSTNATTAAWGLADASLIAERNFVNGNWTEARGQARFDVQDPATDESIGSCPESSEPDVKEAISHASKAFLSWRRRSGRDRSRVLRKWFDLVIENRDDLVKIICRENGKAQADAAGEVNMAAGFLEWFSEEASRIHGDVVPHSNPAYRVSVIKEPIGVCGMITPWNFPAAMLTRKLGASLAAGCTAVIKPDGQTPFTANAFAVLAQRAGLPPGTINIVHALQNTPAVGKVLCEAPGVRKLSFTGSTRVGKILLAQSASNVQKLSLELGGNAPFIVFDDADLETAVTALIASKFKVSGQTCVCPNRVYVQAGIHDQFVDKLVEAVSAFKVGHAAEPTTTHGPLINRAAAAKSLSHIQDAVSKGGRVVIGENGDRSNTLKHGPNFVHPTVLVNANKTMLVAREETFGPVAAVFKFENEAEVIADANDVDVGLASYFMTKDHERAHRVAEVLQAGMVAINTGIIADAAAPFGGVKASGMGREGSKYGIEEYLQLKTVVTGNLRL